MTAFALSTIDETEAAAMFEDLAKLGELEGLDAQEPR